MFYRRSREKVTLSLSLPLSLSPLSLSLLLSLSLSPSLPLCLFHFLILINASFCLNLLSFITKKMAQSFHYKHTVISFLLQRQKDKIHYFMKHNIDHCFITNRQAQKKETMTMINQHEHSYLSYEEIHKIRAQNT